MTPRLCVLGLSSGLGVWDTGYAVVQIRPGPSIAYTVPGQRYCHSQALYRRFCDLSGDFGQYSSLELNHAIHAGRRRPGFTHICPRDNPKSIAYQPT